MTSWWVTSSISLTRTASNAAFLRMRCTASAGISPSSASASQARISNSSHLASLLSSDQIRPISGRV